MTFSVSKETKLAKLLTFKNLHTFGQSTWEINKVNYYQNYSLFSIEATTGSQKEAQLLITKSSILSWLPSRKEASWDAWCCKCTILGLHTVGYSAVGKTCYLNTRESAVPPTFSRKVIEEKGELFLLKTMTQVGCLVLKVTKFLVPKGTHYFCSFKQYPTCRFWNILTVDPWFSEIP